jgi:hypothetical protein
MMKATSVRRFIDLMRAFEPVVASMAAKFDAKHEAFLQDIPDETFRLMVLGVAGAFVSLRDEAIRRGIWDELKTQRPER